MATTIMTPPVTWYKFSPSGHDIAHAVQVNSGTAWLTVCGKYLPDNAVKVNPHGLPRCRACSIKLGIHSTQIKK